MNERLVSMRKPPMRLLGAAGAVALIMAISAGPASASYMAKCNKLISTWKACTESSQDCSSEEQAIEQQCKCHARKGNEWKLVMAAVGKDDVCEKQWPPTTPPDPSPPRHDNSDGGRGGNHR